MKLNLSVRRIFLSLSAIVGLSFSSCQPEAILPEEGFALHYPSVSEIAPGSFLEVVPTWYGGTPSEFAISSLTFDGAASTAECFTINPDTGALSIRIFCVDAEGTCVRINSKTFRCGSCTIKCERADCKL